MHYSESKLATLLREQGHPVTFVPKPERKHNTSRVSESREQQALMKWWDAWHKSRAIHRTLFMAFPLQGARSARNGARMKREGCRKGTPDMLLAVPRGACHGLWIELKAPDQINKSDGGVSEEQWDILHALNGQGYATVVAYSCEDAKSHITSYLSQ